MHVYAFVCMCVCMNIIICICKYMCMTNSLWSENEVATYFCFCDDVHL